MCNFEEIRPLIVYPVFAGRWRYTSCTIEDEDLVLDTVRTNR